MIRYIAGFIVTLFVWLVFGAVDGMFVVLPEANAANTLLTLSLITHRALFVLENSLTATSKINREYDDRFAVSGAKIGATADVRKPPRFVVSRGQSINIQAADETSVPITCDIQSNIAFEFSSADKVMSIDDYSRRFLEPAVSQLGNDVDEEVCKIITKVPYFIGTPGAIPSTSSTYTKAHAILDYNSVPRNAERTMIITPDMETNLIEALKGLFHQGETISMQFRSNHMGHAFGWDFYMDQNCYTHTVGTYSGADPLVLGAGQTGAELDIDGMGNGGVLEVGDIIQMAGVYHVNPKNRKSTGRLQPFVVQQRAVASAGGVINDLKIDPPISPPGADGVVKDQTVSAGPLNNAVITVFGHKSTSSGKVSPQGFGFHRDFATLACVDLGLPGESHQASRAQDKQLGLSMRIVEGYNISDDKFPCRIDILYGVSSLRPELCVRVLS